MAFVKHCCIDPGFVLGGLASRYHPPFGYARGQNDATGHDDQENGQYPAKPTHSWKVLCGTREGGFTFISSPRGKSVRRSSMAGKLAASPNFPDVGKCGFTPISSALTPGAPRH